MGKIGGLLLLLCASGAQAADLTITVPADVPAGTYTLTPVTTPPPEGGGGPPPGNAGDTPFTALHTYYLASNGKDSNSGTSAAAPWATPNHPLNCGDVIIAAPGTYNSAFTNWGAVSNCPSTSGGIDGKGGIWFATLLCGGADLEACKMTVSSGPDAFSMRANNWAIEGWKTTAGQANAYIMKADANGTTQLHHIAFVNDICFNSAMGFQGSDGALNHNVPGNGVDYYAYVGLIAQDCAQSGWAVAGINIVGPSPWDSAPGTHIFSSGNFALANRFPGGGSTDGESFMFDAIDAHGYNGTIVTKNNIGAGSTRWCVMFTYAGYNRTVPQPTIKVANTSCFGNNQDFSTSDNGNGEVHFGYNYSSGGATSGGWIVSLKDNLAETNKASQNGQPIYALGVGGVNWPSLTSSGNFWKASATVCKGTCDTTSAPFNASFFNGNNKSAQDTFGKSPAFTDTTDLMANRLGVPQCAGSALTTECMSKVVADLKPTANGTAGKGFQPASKTCAADPDFPTWLKGMVTLHWTGSAIVQQHGQVTTPCGL